jgi:[ribosomal protein S5]-alanine N-acetyltransferase
MTSDRLTYEPLAPAHLEAFHRLVEDEHVRRYLMDGNVFPREWSAERIRESQELFRRRGVGIWLARDKASHELVGFCGFLEMPQVHPDPQIVYAMFERFTSKGYAGEMARAAIAHARTQAGFEAIVAAVDEVNAASLRVLEKLGFERIATQPGHFGNVWVLRLDGSVRSVEAERRKW